MAIVGPNMAEHKPSTTDLIKLAISAATSRFAETPLGELADAYEKKPYDFKALCSIGNLLPELHLITFLYDCRIRECPIIGHFETAGTEIFPLYSLGESECPSCGKPEIYYKAILATSQGYLLTDCSLNNLTPVNSNIKTIADVRAHLERYYNFPHIFGDLKGGYESNGFCTSIHLS